MSISSTEQVTTNPFLAASPDGAAGTSTTTASEDKQMFLELLVAQLRYQDPLNPTDSGQFLAQSAQFTALEKMQEVADATGALLGAQMAFGASALVGRQVSWTDEAGAVLTGTVDSVTFGETGPVFDVAGTSVPLAQVTTVTSPSGSPSGSTGTSGSPATTP